MKYIIFVILLCLYISCEKNENLKLGNNEPTPLKSSEILARLNEAYDADSTEALYQILEDWHNENKPVKKENLENDTIKNVYEVYIEFYTPFDIDRIGGSEWGNEIYENVSYYVIQNRILYDFVYESLAVTIPDTVFDFRPELSFDNGVKPLFLTENYDTALNDFLGATYIPFGTGGIMNPASAAEDSYERQQFINNYLLVIYLNNFWSLA